ncbi:DUF3566 domain-containing protein [archaeon]|nr:DUF3566 domain-containing protein [archaeon]
MQELKKIGVLSAAKISVLFGILMGLILDIFSLVWIKFLLSLYEVTRQMFVGDTAVAYPTWLQGFNTLWQTTLMVVMSWVIFALIYNGFAKLVGGVKVDLKDAPMKKKASKKK